MDPHTKRTIIVMGVIAAIAAALLILALNAMQDAIERGRAERGATTPAAAGPSGEGATVPPGRSAVRNAQETGGTEPTDVDAPVSPRARR